MPSRSNVSKKREGVNCVPLSVVPSSSPRGCPQAVVRARAWPVRPLRARLRFDSDARDSIHDLSRTAVNHTPGMPAQCRTLPDLRHVRLPDLIRLGCFKAAPLFLPSRAKTTWRTATHVLASPVTPACDSRAALSSAVATTSTADRGNTSLRGVTPRTKTRQHANRTYISVWELKHDEPGSPSW
jgi:hypothetical protein